MKPPPNQPEDRFKSIDDVKGPYCLVDQADNKAAPIALGEVEWSPVNEENTLSRPLETITGIAMTSHYNIEPGQKVVVNLRYVKWYSPMEPDKLQEWINNLKQACYLARIARAGGPMK